MNIHELFTLRAAYTEGQREALALFRSEFDRALRQPELWSPLRVRLDSTGKVSAHRELYGEVRLRTCPEPLGSLLTYGFTVCARRVRDARGGLYSVSSEPARAPTQLVLLVRPCDIVGAAADCETVLDWSALRRRVARETLRDVRAGLAERREELQRLRKEYRAQAEYARALQEEARVGK